MQSDPARELSPNQLNVLASYPEATEHHPHTFREFGQFRVDALERVLWHADRRVDLRGKSFDVLIALLQGDGRALAKEELLDSVWPQKAVEEANLTVAVSHLRKILRAADPSHHYIETLPGRGYRFFVSGLASQPSSVRPGFGRPSAESTDDIRSALTEHEIQRYLDARFAQHRLPSSLARLIQTYSAGAALFIAQMIDTLVDKRLLQCLAGTWIATVDVADLHEHLLKRVEARHERLPVGRARVRRLSLPDLDPLKDDGSEFELSSFTKSALDNTDSGVGF